MKPLAFLLFGLFSTAAALGAGPAAGEMSRAREFARRFESAEALPFSFRCGGRDWRERIGDWKIERGPAKEGDRAAERTIVLADRTSGLRVSCSVKEYRDLPALDWVLHVSNGGTEDTPILEAIRPLDVLIPGPCGGAYTVHRALGESNSERSFAPVEDALSPSRPGPLVLAPVGGRSSDGHMPYFNVAWSGGGIALAIGWSGQWQARFEVREEGALRISAGQEIVHFKLHPGETVRTPRILLVFWEGDDAIRGNNLFRRTLLAHYMPRRGGELVLPPVCASVNWVGPGGDYEGPHTSVMKPLADRGIEVFWSDMDPQQWYPKGFPEGTGTWEPDPAKYPRGLKPVGDAARAAGLGYLLWFEPERVHPGTKIDREHPEFVMRAQGEWSQLFRLHDSSARRWLTELIDRTVREAGLSWIRWDFNIEPLGFWLRNDPPDRQGITEIRHIEGLYAMWDELRARHPGLAIDVCASGGRRIDIETCSRGLPLWHSDLQCGGPHPVADQLQNGGLFRWVPLHGCGNFAYEPSYVFRSAMTAGNILCHTNARGHLDAADPETEEAVRRTVEIYRRVRPCMLGDFYPLFPHDASESVWYGYQFDNPELGMGCAILFRREKSPEARRRIALRALEPGSEYEISLEDAGKKAALSGSALAALEVEIPSAPGSEIVWYRKLGAR